MLSHFAVREGLWCRRGSSSRHRRTIFASRLWGCDLVVVPTVEAARAGRRAALAVVAATALLVVTACSSGTTTIAATRTSRSVPPLGSTTPASPADEAKQQALAAYQGMWAEFEKAGTTSDWQDQALGQYATGVALTNLTRGLYADHANGLVTKGAPVLNPSVTSITPSGNPTSVVIADCGDSTHYLKYYASNGQPAPDGPGGRQYIKATVDKQAGGAWKVADFGIQGLGTC